MEKFARQISRWLFVRKIKGKSRRMAFREFCQTWFLQLSKWAFPEESENKEKRKTRWRGSLCFFFSFFFGRIIRTSRYCKFHDSVYIKVGAPTYGSLHLGYAERKGSSSTENRPPRERARIQTRVQLDTHVAGRRSVRFSSMYIHGAGSVGSQRLMLWWQR